MRAIPAKCCLVVFIALALTVAFLALPSLARKNHEISGKMTMTKTTEKQIDVGDAEDHRMILAEYEGTNECTEKNTFMDGAQVVNMSFADLVQGNGPHQGHAKFILGEDTVFCRWEGVVTTTVPEEGNPIMAFEGTFSYTKGTGQYESIQGSGVYSGRFTSKTELTVDWNGEYSIAE